MARTVRQNSFRYFRRMRTTQQRRENHAFAIDARKSGLKIPNRDKARGNLATLPNAWWDECPSGDLNHRSVKNPGDEIRRLNKD